MASPNACDAPPRPSPGPAVARPSPAPSRTVRRAVPLRPPLERGQARAARPFASLRELRQMHATCLPETCRAREDAQLRDFPRLDSVFSPKCIQYEGVAAKEALLGEPPLQAVTKSAGQRRGATPRRPQAASRRPPGPARRAPSIHIVKKRERRGPVSRTRSSAGASSG